MANHSINVPNQESAALNINSKPQLRLITTKASCHLSLSQSAAFECRVQIVGSLLVGKVLPLLQKISHIISFEFWFAETGVSYFARKEQQVKSNNNGRTGRITKLQGQRFILAICIQHLMNWRIYGDSWKLLRVLRPTRNTDLLR